MALYDMTGILLTRSGHTWTYLNKICLLSAVYGSSKQICYTYEDGRDWRCRGMTEWW